MGDPESVDFRSDRMPSAEGQGRSQGNLRGALDRYSRVVSTVSEPLARRMAKRLAAPMTLDVMGFWLAWHLEGGFEGLQRLGMSRASIYRRVKVFREIFGVHPDEYEFPGVSIDLDEYLREGHMTVADRSTHPKLKSQTTDK